MISLMVSLLLILDNFHVVEVAGIVVVGVEKASERWTKSLLKRQTRQTTTMTKAEGYILGKGTMLSLLLMEANDGSDFLVEKTKRFGTFDFWVSLAVWIARCHKNKQCDRHQG
jgi:hypothetical protein